MLIVKAGSSAERFCDVNLHLSAIKRRAVAFGSRVRRSLALSFYQ